MLYDGRRRRGLSRTPPPSPRRHSRRQTTSSSARCCQPPYRLHGRFVAMAALIPFKLLSFAICLITTITRISMSYLQLNSCRSGTIWKKCYSALRDTATVTSAAVIACLLLLQTEVPVAVSTVIRGREVVVVAAISTFTGMTCSPSRWAA